MLGLGSNISKTGKLGVHDLGVVTSNLVLKHNYDLSSVQLLSDGAASFNGTNTYIGIGDIGAVKSLAFWFNSEIDYDSSVNGDRIIAFAGSSYLGITMGSATGGLVGEVLTVLPDSSSRTATTTTFTANTWYHVCISWNASSGYFDIYINGVLSTDLNTGTHTLSNWDNFNIGTDNTGGTHFGGYICNIGVWDATLSQPQIKSIMNKNYAGLSDSEKTSLVSWWNLDSTIPGVSAVYDNHGGEIGQELVSNGDFSNGLAGWVGNPETTLSVSDNELDIQSSSASGEYGAAFCEVNFEAGKTYLIKLTVVSCDVSSHIRVGGNASATDYSQNIWASGDIGIGTHSKVYTPSQNNAYLAIGGRNDVTTLVIDNVSVKEINGNTGTLS